MDIICTIIIQIEHISWKLEIVQHAATSNILINLIWPPKPNIPGHIPLLEPPISVSKMCEESLPGYRTYAQPCLWVAEKTQEYRLRKCTYRDTRTFCSKQRRPHSPCCRMHTPADIVGTSKETGNVFISAKLKVPPCDSRFPCARFPRPPPLNRLSLEARRISLAGWRTQQREPL